MICLLVRRQALTGVWINVNWDWRPKQGTRGLQLLCAPRSGGGPGEGGGKRLAEREELAGPRASRKSGADGLPECRFAQQHL